MPLVLIISHVKNVKIISRVPRRTNATLLISQTITICLKTDSANKQLTKSLINQSVHNLKNDHGANSSSGVSSPRRRRLTSRFKPNTNSD